MAQPVMERSSLGLSNGDRVTAIGRLVRDGAASVLCPPEPIDRIRAIEGVRGAPDTSLRLVLTSEDTSRDAPSEEWVRVQGVWVERQITVDAVVSIPPDLSLIDGPSKIHQGAEVFDRSLRDEVCRTFLDRRRRWDLLFVSPAGPNRPGPVAVVAAVWAVPELIDYVAGLPEGAVELRMWLTAA